MKNKLSSIVVAGSIFIFSGCGNTDTTHATIKAQNENLTKELLDDLLASNENNVIKNNRSIVVSNSDDQEIVDILDRVKKVTVKSGRISEIAKSTIINGKQIAHSTKKNNDIYLASYWLGKSKNSNLKGIFVLKKYTSKKSGKIYKNIVLVFEVKYKNSHYDGKVFAWAKYIKDLPKLDSQVEPLNKPLLIDPVYNKEVSQSDVKFKWREPKGAEFYRFVISTKSNFGNFVDSGSASRCKTSDGCWTEVVAYNNYEIPHLAKSGQTYYWKVRAANTSTASEWSKTEVFRTKGESVNTTGLAGSGNRLTTESFNSGFYREVKENGKYVNGLWYRGFAPARFYTKKGQYSELESWAKGNCTWYARARARQMGGEVPYHSWGNAKDFDNKARTDGYVVNYAPAVGAIAQTDSGTYGHVAVVEKVNSNGTIDISESSYSSTASWNFEYRYRTVASNKFKYIHVER